MNTGKLAAYVLNALALLALVLLGSGWTGLENLLPGGLPVGNALSALAMIFAAGAAVLFSIAGSRVRGFSRAALLVAVLWLPASIALAGNLELNFRESTATAWFAFTVLAFVASFGALLVALATSLMRRP